MCKSSSRLSQQSLRFDELFPQREKGRDSILSSLGRQKKELNNSVWLPRHLLPSPFTRLPLWRALLARPPLRPAAAANALRALRRGEEEASAVPRSRLAWLSGRVARCHGGPSTPVRSVRSSFGQDGATPTRTRRTRSRRRKARRTTVQVGPFV